MCARMAAAVVGLQVVYVSFFAFPGHDPKPNGLKIGTVGTQPQVAEAEKQISGVLPRVDEVRFRTARQARRAVEDARSTARSCSPRTEGGGPHRAGGELHGQLVADAGRRRGAGQAGRSRPLDDGGPRGTVFNLLIVPLVVTTLLGAQLATLLIEDVPVRRRLGVVGGVAVLSGFAIATLVGPSSARFRACFPCSPPPSR